MCVAFSGGCMFHQVLVDIVCCDRCIYMHLGVI